MEINRNVCIFVIFSTFIFSCKSSKFEANNDIKSNIIDFPGGVNVKIKDSSVVFVKNIDVILLQSKKEIEGFLKLKKFNLEEKKIFYIVSYFSSDNYEICSKEFNLEIKSYKTFFKNWDFQNFVTGYICDERGKYIASTTSYTLINNPYKYNDYIFYSELLQLGFDKNYKAFINLNCKGNAYYIGFNDVNLDIYTVINEKLILL